MKNMQEIVRIKQIINETEHMPIDYVTSPLSVVHWLQKEIGDESQEVLVLLCLNTKNKVTHYSIVHRGSVSQSIAHPRDIFERALLCNATSIILSHCHPSQTCTPSTHDNKFTERIVECGKLMGIEVLDHIIVSRISYYSYKQEEQL